MVDQTISEAELAELLDIKVEEVAKMMSGGRRHLSTDAPVADDSEATMLDLFVDDEDSRPDMSLMDESLQKEIAMGLSQLSPREVEVLSSCYGLNGKTASTLEEIGDMYGLTRERVRQIRERAIRRLRKSVNKNALKSYLG